MDFFSDPEFIKLAALGCAFVVGVSICIYVAIRETAELNRRRRAKKLIYQDAVQRELARKRQLMQRMRAQEDMDGIEQPSGGQSQVERSGNQSFA